MGWAWAIPGAWPVLDGLGIEIELAAAAFVLAFGMIVESKRLFRGDVQGAEGTMGGLLLPLYADSGTAVAATSVIRLAPPGFAVALGFLALPLVVLAGRPRLDAAGVRPS